MSTFRETIFPVLTYFNCTRSLKNKLQNLA